MANPTQPFGLRPYTDQEHTTARYYITAGLNTGGVYKGDPIVMSANGEDATATVPLCAVWSSGAINGVVKGITPDSGGTTDWDKNYLPSGVAGYLDVIIDPRARYTIRANGDITTAANLRSAVNGNCNLEFGTASDVLGLSGCQLDGSTLNTTATLPVRILGILSDGVNEVSTNTIFVVRINNHADSTGTGTAGV